MRYQIIHLITKSSNPSKQMSSIVENPIVENLNVNNMIESESESETKSKVTKPKYAIRGSPLSAKLTLVEKDLSRAFPQNQLGKPTEHQRWSTGFSTAERSGPVLADTPPMSCPSLAMARRGGYAYFRECCC